MALTKFDRDQCERIVCAYIEKRRPPVHVRSKIDLAFRVTARGVEIFEIVPSLDDVSAKFENSVAKTTYLKSRETWQIYWQRGNLKWQSYEPVPAVASLEEFLSVVEEDKFGCFWG